MDPPPYAEVLGPEPAESLGERGGRWLRAHPRGAAILALLLVLLLIAAGSVALARHLRRPDLPTLSISDDGDLPSDAPWPTGGDGRPSGPVELSVNTKLTVGPMHDLTRVIGISGPGVGRPAGRPVRLRGNGTASVALSSMIDCESLPATIPTGAYGLRVQAVSGSRSRTAVIRAGPAGERWRTMIALACAAWSARRDVTATDLSTVVSPTRPRVDVSLSLVNRGERPVTVTAGDTGAPIHLSGGLPVRIGPHSTGRAAFSVVLDRCDSVAPIRNQTAPLSSDAGLTSVINLVGLAGSLPLSAGTSFPGAGGDSGLGATGLVLDPAAARALASGLSRACGQLDPAFALITPNGSRYQARTRVLSVPITVLTTPGRVRVERVRLVPMVGYAGAYRPAADTVQELVPDRTGQARVTLRFRSPPAGRCPDGGVSLPGLLITLDLTGPGGRRTVSYSERLELSADPAALRLLCGKN